MLLVAFVNPPPAYTSLPNTAKAETPPFTPESSADQLLPFHLAIELLVGYLYAVAAYTSLPATASAEIYVQAHRPGSGPPRDDQS